MAEPTTQTPTWTAPTPAEVDGPLLGADRPILEGYLAWQRRSFLNICAGLTAEQLATRAIPSSNLSLLGIVRHLAKVERIWFRIRVAGQDVPPVFPLGSDVDFDEIDAAEAPDWVARLAEEMRLSDEAIAGVDFETTIEAREVTMSLRSVLVHVITEYARHNGHADLIREAIDGVTGR
jgi:uncharacterized damage-inducible protein DinB